MKNIYLASDSARRKLLLEQIGLEFKILKADYEEDLGLQLSPTELVEHLSLGKAKAACKLVRNGLVIAADTVAVLGRNVLGKPRDEEHAEIMLTALSGKTIDSVTGFTIIDAENWQTLTRSVTTKVFFKTLDEEEIDAYVRSGEALGKAGAFGIQGRGALLVDRIEGDYNTIVGLPLSALHVALKEFGLNILI
jgi:septum formation protein